MNCKCKHCTTVLAIVILIFSFWQVWFASWLNSRWIIIVAAVLILLHGICCNCYNDRNCNTRVAVRKKSPVKKKTAKRKKRK